MAIGWDPKSKSVARGAHTTTPDGSAQPSKSGGNRAAAEAASMERPKALVDEPTRPKTHPTRHTQSGSKAQFETHLDKLRELLAQEGTARRAGARQAIAMACGYSLRRSRGARKRGLELLEGIAESDLDEAHAAAGLAEILRAEGKLHELTAEATMAASASLLRALDEELPNDIAALGRTILANGLLQLATHFPDGAEELDATPAGLLEHAFFLAESAVEAAPHLPDGHCALARLVLLHDGPEALEDAKTILDHALREDPDHDPSQLCLALVELEQGDRDGALLRVDDVLRGGNGHPLAFLLRGLIHEARGDLTRAKADVTRAHKLAPQVGLLALDTARITESGELRELALQLLGETGSYAADVL